MVMKKRIVLNAALSGIIGLGVVTAPLIVNAQAQKPHSQAAHVQKTYSNEAGTVTLTEIKPHVWVHTSIGEFNGMPVPSNGLLMETSKGLLLVDSSWNDSITTELMDLISKHLKKPVKNAIITHSHADRIGGIKTLKERGVHVYTTPQTAKLGAENGYESPDRLLNPVSTHLKFGNVKVETYYPGKGHTEDNITVYFPQYKLLVGGCLIKSQEAKDLGNLEDADVDAWPVSVQNVIDRYPQVDTVVPGHGNLGGTELLYHTIELLENNK